MGRPKKRATETTNRDRLPTEMREKLVAWYDENARDLPFRRTRDPYAIWVSEVMLQQTRVETVLPYWARFLERFPTATALAAASEQDVLTLWSGLGYYRRARLLRQGAMHVADVHGGHVPADVEAIRAIPGVGPYTTGAIASQAFGLAAPLVDGNVARLFSRLFAIDDDVKRGAGLARVWAIAAELVKGERPGTLNNALMELGALVCVPREPRCLLCPVSKLCKARRQGKERELPVAAEKPVRPRVAEIAAVLRLKGRDGVLLARCAPSAKSRLFVGMWEPPRVGTHDAHAARAMLEAMLGVDVRLEPEPAGRIEHVLSHRHLDVVVHEGTLARAPRLADSPERYDELAFVPPSQLAERGVSSLAKKLLGVTRRG